MVLDRFSMPAPAGLAPEQEQQWVSQKLTPVRLRVFNVLKNWLENYALDTDSNDVLAVDMVRVFAEETMKEVMASAAAQLLRILNKMTLNGGNASTRKLVQNNRECPPPILPRNLNRIKFLELDPLEVARQLTVMESGLYARIMPSEFLKQAWSETAGDKDGKGKSVNVRAMIATSNQITGWVASSILMEKDLKKRSQIMKQFIYIADRCRNLNNFNTLMSIIAGLNSAPIHRLKRTWDQLSQRSMAILDALRQTMRREKNFSVYRETLHSANPPCVPFLGFYLTDLTFIEEGNPDMLNGNGKSILAQRQSDSSNPNGLINFSKRMKTAEVIREIQQYQNVGYLLQTVPELQHWLRSCLRDAGEMESNGLWDISMTLEPREREDEKIARLLQESGFL
ncbi:ras guanine nucleotide exchange factor domain-containing protein [Gaertneriomyces semiglobifer]|nr:ras guanine nucleotide exchange factor domain-containing protein [Gaertneriomyces semiglobifer]